MATQLERSPITVQPIRKTNALSSIFTRLPGYVTQIAFLTRRLDLWDFTVFNLYNITPLTVHDMLSWVNPCTVLRQAHMASLHPSVP